MGSSLQTTVRRVAVSLVSALTLAGSGVVGSAAVAHAVTSTTSVTASPTPMNKMSAIRPGGTDPMSGASNEAEPGRGGQAQGGQGQGAPARARRQSARGFLNPANHTSTTDTYAITRETGS
jgi:hypothetical protein